MERRYRVLAFCILLTPVPIWGQGVDVAAPAGLPAIGVWMLTATSPGMTVWMP